MDFVTKRLKICLAISQYLKNQIGNIFGMIDSGLISTLIDIGGISKAYVDQMGPRY